MNTLKSKGVRYGDNQERPRRRPKAKSAAANRPAKPREADAGDVEHPDEDEGAATEPPADAVEAAADELDAVDAAAPPAPEPAVAELVEPAGSTLRAYRSYGAAGLGVK